MISPTGANRRTRNWRSTSRSTRGDFAQDQRFTFRQVYLNREKRGEHLDADAAELLARLTRQPLADVGELGDELLLPREFTDEAQRDVAAQLGRDFAAALANLTDGQWSGPIRSGYGVHLVLVTRRTEGRLPALAGGAGSGQA